MLTLLLFDIRFYFHSLTYLLYFICIQSSILFLGRLRKVWRYQRRKSKKDWQEKDKRTNKTLHRKQKIWRTWTNYKPGVNAGAPERWVIHRKICLSVSLNCQTIKRKIVFMYYVNNTTKEKKTYIYKHPDDLLPNENIW